MLLLANDAGNKERLEDEVIANMLQITPQAVHGKRSSSYKGKNTVPYELSCGIGREKREDNHIKKVDHEHTRTILINISQWRT